MYRRKKLGVIGGMGSRAGIAFLEKVIDYSPAEKDQEFLEIFFHNNALIPDRTRAIVYNEASPMEEILRSFSILNHNDVEVIALSCITSYYYYDDFLPFTNALIMNPLKLVVGEIENEYPGARRIGVLATTGTIKSGLFHRELNSHGLDVISLDPGDQENLFMQAVYMKNGFKSAHISDDARSLMYKAFETISRKKVDLIIGGCTEVSIGVDPQAVSYPYLDALDLLARKTVDYCYRHDMSEI